MKRSTPLRRTSSLRRSPMRSRRGSTSYSRRERDFEFMGWVKRQSCMLRELSLVDFTRSIVALPDDPCSGPIEADHMGSRGISQKADDNTCVPMCTHHHRRRTDHSGPFRYLTRDELRAWRAAAIERTQTAWSNR